MAGHAQRMYMVRLGLHSDYMTRVWVSQPVFLPPSSEVNECSLTLFPLSIHI